MSLTNSQYDALMREYEEKHRNAIMERDVRLAHVNATVDGYKELSDAISGLTLEHTKRAIAGDKGALVELKLLINDLKDQKQALLSASGYPDDYLEPVFECPDCNDTGYINNAKCHCFKQKIISIMFAQSGISKMLDSVSFERASDRYYSGEALSDFRDSKEKSISFVNNFDSVYQNLLFYGTVGSGKSLLSACIAKEILAKGHSVIYFSSSALFDELSKRTFNHSLTNNSLEDIYECDLLIIDDLGTEMATNFTASAMFSLLNERFLRKKSVVISTNLTLEDLRSRYTDRIFSRVTGGFEFCHMTGPDLRITHGTL